VLRSVCEHMDSALSLEVPCVLARALADPARSKLALEKTDLQTVLNLERNLGAPPAPALHPRPGRLPEEAEG
jgi:hypothetical protein